MTTLRPYQQRAIDKIKASIRNTGINIHKDLGKSVTFEPNTRKARDVRREILKQFNETKRKYQAGEILLYPYQEFWAQQIASGEKYLRDVPTGYGYTLIAVRVQEILESEQNVTVTFEGMNDD